LIHWFVVWLVHWFVDWLVHCFIDSFSHCFIASLLDCFIASLIHWFIDPLLHSFIDSLVHCFVASLLDWSLISLVWTHWTEWLIDFGFVLIWFRLDWLVGSLIRWSIASFRHWFTDSWIRWLNDSWMHWFIDSFSQLCMILSLASQQPCAHLLVRLTTSTLPCFCISKKSYRSSSYSVYSSPILFDTSAPERAGHYLVISLS
jgi:hypothetical protein